MYVEAPLGGSKTDLWWARKATHVRAETREKWSPHVMSSQEQSAGTPVLFLGDTMSCHMIILRVEKRMLRGSMQLALDSHAHLLTVSPITSDHAHGQDTTQLLPTSLFIRPTSLTASVSITSAS